MGTLVLRPASQVRAPALGREEPAWSCATERSLSEKRRGSSQGGRLGLQSGAGKLLLGQVSPNGGTSGSGHFGEDTGLGHREAAGGSGGLGKLRN